MEEYQRQLVMSAVALLATALGLLMILVIVMHLRARAAKRARARAPPGQLDDVVDGEFMSSCLCGGGSHDYEKVHQWRPRDYTAGIVAALHMIIVGLGWLLIFWGGIVQGSLFKTLSDRDFWMVFAIWMSENLTKFLYMFPEGDFYRKYTASALHGAAMDSFLVDCCPWMPGLNSVSFFDIVQFGLSMARLVLGGFAIQALRSQRCSTDFKYEDILATGYPDRVCAGLWIFYTVAVAKASLSLIKYAIVVAWADCVPSPAKRAENLVSILVHETHGFSMTPPAVEHARIKHESDLADREDIHAVTTGSFNRAQEELKDHKMELCFSKLPNPPQAPGGFPSPPSPCFNGYTLRARELATDLGATIADATDVGIGTSRAFNSVLDQMVASITTAAQQQGVTDNQRQQAEEAKDALRRVRIPEP